MLNCINWQTNIHFSPLVTRKKVNSMLQDTWTAVGEHGLDKQIVVHPSGHHTHLLMQDIKGNGYIASKEKHVPWVSSTFCIIQPNPAFYCILMPSWFSAVAMLGSYVSAVLEGNGSFIDRYKLAIWQFKICDKPVYRSTAIVLKDFTRSMRRLSEWRIRLNGLWRWIRSRCAFGPVCKGRSANTVRTRRPSVHCLTKSHFSQLDLAAPLSTVATVFAQHGVTWDSCVLTHHHQRERRRTPRRTSSAREKKCLLKTLRKIFPTHRAQQCVLMC